MLNEHHQTATCVDPAAPLMLAALARLTHKARLLILGNPIANRRQPVRVAEEMAMVDVLSRGRLEAGFVRGVPYEILPANSNPVRMNERQWEALDLIIKAWTSHDGPFSLEGRFFHYRAVNIWPRPISSRIRRSGSARPARRAPRGSARAATCRRRSSPASTARARSSTRIAAAGARRGAATTCRRPPGLCRAGLYRPNEADARAGAEKLLWYITSNKVPPHFANPPGYVPVQANVRCCAARSIR